MKLNNTVLVLCADLSFVCNSNGFCLRESDAETTGGGITGGVRTVKSLE